MSDTAAETQAPDAEGQGTDGKSGGGTSTTDQPLTLTQEEFNRKLDDRLKRERAKFSDYNDLKVKASRLDELEQANKSEIEKATDRVSKAEAEVAQIPVRVAEQLRAHLVALHSIPEDDAELFLTANDPQLLLKQVQRLMSREQEREQERKKQGNFVPNEGKSAPAAEGDEHVIVQRLFGG